MRTFVYGIVFGAAGMYLYLTQGALVDDTVADLMQWREGARESVHGYSSGRR